MEQFSKLQMFGKTYVGIWIIKVPQRPCIKDSVPDGGTISSDSRDLASGIKPEEIGHLGTHYYWQLFDVLFGSWLAMMETALLWHLFLQP